MARVWVVGSINMDLVATAPRHPEVGETVLGDDLARFPGGKGANQAVAAVRAGSSTAMVGAVGGDDFGLELTGFLADQGVDVGHVATKSERPTGTALIVVARADNTIVVVPGANADLVSADLPDAARLAAGDVVVAQLETPQETTAAMFAAARARGTITVLNAAPAAPLLDGLVELTDHLVVNESEWEQLRPRLAVDARPTVICTLGARGVVTIAPDGMSAATPGIAVDAVDATGAGDCFVGYLAAGLATGMELEASVTRANSAAAMSVKRSGAAPSMPYAREIDQP